jgi:hypothetical protein
MYKNVENIPKGRSMASQGADMSNEPRRLEELEEAVGTLLQVTELDGFVVAVFTWGAVSLPEELGPQLRELQGRRISVLRFGGYRVRCLDKSS